MIYKVVAISIGSSHSHSRIDQEVLSEFESASHAIDFMTWRMFIRPDDPRKLLLVDEFGGILWGDEIEDWWVEDDPERIFATRSAGGGQ